MKDTKFRDIAYWSAFIFAAVVCTRLILGLINMSATEEIKMYSQFSWQAKSATTIHFETNYGPFAITLDRRNAPIASSNFAELVRSAFYDGTKFHKVLKNVYVMGGDPLSRARDKELWGTGGPGYVFQDEISGLKMRRGAVAMAHIGKNGVDKADTNGSQFFILVADHAETLDGQYTIFGHVTDGMDTIDKIAALPLDENAIPLKPVIIESSNIY